MEAEGRSAERDAGGDCLLGQTATAIRPMAPTTKPDSPRFIRISKYAECAGKAVAPIIAATPEPKNVAKMVRNADRLSIPDPYQRPLRLQCIYSPSHYCSVEVICFARQCHCITLLEPCDTISVSFSSEAQLRHGRINTQDFRRFASLHQKFSKRTVSTANVNPALMACGIEPVYKDLTCEAAPDAHHSFIS